MTRWNVLLFALIALVACGGAVDEDPDEKAEAGELKPNLTDVESPPSAPAAPRQIPLCSGSLEQSPELCQELHYGSAGYCNRWVSCEATGETRNACGWEHPESCPPCPGNELIHVDADLVTVWRGQVLGFCGKLYPLEPTPPARPESTASAPTLPQDEPAPTQAAEVVPEADELASAPEPSARAIPAELPAITFSIVGEDVWNRRFPEPNLHTGLDNALARWSAATCRTLTVLPEGAQHTVKWGDSTTVQPGRFGQTTGSWDAALIQSKKITRGATPIILVHELAHLLARSNDHATDGVYSGDPFAAGHDVITAADLTKVCAALRCECFSPEIGEPQTNGEKE